MWLCVGFCVCVCVCVCFCVYFCGWNYGRLCLESAFCCVWLCVAPCGCLWLCVAVKASVMVYLYVIVYGCKVVSVYIEYGELVRNS